MTLRSQKDLARAILPRTWITGGVGTTPDGRIAIRVAPGRARSAEVLLRSGGVTAPLDLVEMGFPRARNSTFPRLEHPISLDQLYDELCGICDLGGIGDFDVFLDPSVTAEHERNHRRYAQVTTSGDPPVFEFADQTLLLPWPHRLGLYAHEVGHLLDPDPKKSESSADATALRSLGIRVGYDRRWPGKGLQVALDGPGIDD